MERWVVECWDSSAGEWVVEATFTNEEDCSSYYRNIKIDYPDVIFRVTRG